MAQTIFPLSWSGIPPTAKCLALIVADPDAPDPAVGKMLVHAQLPDRGVDLTVTHGVAGGHQACGPGHIGSRWFGFDDRLF